MISAVIVVVAVTLASSTTMAKDECPCYKEFYETTICDDTSLTSIPDCVPSDITELHIRTPSIPLVSDTINRFKDLWGLTIELFDHPQLSKTFLSGQTNLEYFEISYTSLDYVDNEWFLNTPGLKYVVLEYNKITTLDSDIFRSVPLLELVGLDGNQLTTLPPTLFEGTDFYAVSLDNNPWQCDCELATFMQWTRDNGVQVSDEAYCLHPPELEGLNLKDLTPEVVCKK